MKPHLLSVCRPIVTAMLILWAILTPNTASAQTPGQWHDGLFSLHSDGHMSSPWRAVLIDENNIVQREVPQVPEAVAETAKYSPDGVSFWHKDALYTLLYGPKEKDKDGSEFRRFTYAKWEADEWHFLGSYQAKPNEDLRAAIPCDDGRFIVISRRADLVDNNRPDRSPFVRMSIDQKNQKLRIDASIAHGQDGLKNFMSGSGFNLASMSSIVMTDRHATLICHISGLYWVFSLERASLVKAGNIFKMVTPEMIAAGGFHFPVLSANPEKEGTVLIAAQEERLFVTDPGSVGNLYSESALKAISDPFHTLENQMRLLNDKLKAQRENNPFIVWYRLYPESGKVETLTHIEGGATLRAELENDCWRPMPDGSVKMGWVKLKMKEEVPKPEKQEDKAPD